MDDDLRRHGGRIPRARRVGVRLAGRCVTGRRLPPDQHLVCRRRGEGRLRGRLDAREPVSSLRPWWAWPATRSILHRVRTARRNNLDLHGQMVETTRGNFVGEYPAQFYATMHLFAGNNVQLSVLLMRLFNAALFLLALLAVYLALPAGLSRAATWGSLVAMVPLGVFIVPSTNPSSWALTSAAITFVSVVGYVSQDDRRRRYVSGALAAVGIALAAGARARRRPVRRPRHRRRADRDVPLEADVGAAHDPPGGARHHRHGRLLRHRPEFGCEPGFRRRQPGPTGRDPAGQAVPRGAEPVDRRLGLLGAGLDRHRTAVPGLDCNWCGFRRHSDCRPARQSTAFNGSPSFC